MRVIDNIPHPTMRISIFNMNNKFIVKFEAGPMEQVYKFNEESVKGLAALKKIITPQFQEDVLKEFNNMYLLLSEARKK